jgi:spermidine synthase
MAAFVRARVARRVGLFLTLLTGFSGLVYEVTWQKYLAALLGSDSQATATVLGIFLGGLAAGYALFGRVARRRARSGSDTTRLLLLYGMVELAIGVYALCFPVLFRAIQSISHWIPPGPHGVSFAIDAGLCALLIGPPSLLMGGTIPLLTQALATNLHDSTRLHALVYGSNTAGAFAGALCAGFFLIPSLGLDGVMVSIGLLNLGAGAVFAALGSMAIGTAPMSAVAPATAPEPGHDTPAAVASYASVALLSGFAMMTLQTTLNRIGALALGASQFTFSMMVASFILCIALGSFAVSALRRIHPILLPASQWLLVALLLALYPMIPDATYWGHWLRAGFSNDDANFYPFHLAVFGSVLGIFLLPLALSGATLPLLFHHVRGERGDLGSAAGRLYSWNTVGSLLGALLGGYVLLYWLDLHQVYWLATIALACGAALLTARASPNNGRTFGGAALAASLLIVGLQPAWSPYKLSAGLFRDRTPLPYTREGPAKFFAEHRKLRSGDYVAYYNDDPSTSVAVFRYPDSSGVTVTAIITNGKSDGNVPGDYVTMSMLALLPALLAETPERAFVIGYGTGVTVGELTSLDQMKEVVVAEISPGVMEAARYFESYERAAANPKTRVIIGDAYRALLRSPGGFDVIASEPSSLWATGAEMLYSREFLEAARARLSPGGVYLQWVHTYETDSRAVGLVLNTFREVFEQVAVWYSQAGDLLILGFPDADFRIDLDELAARWSQRDFARAFRRIRIDSLAELLAHELLPLSVVHAADMPDELHTIAHPVLGPRAARAFFAPQSVEPLPIRLTLGVRASGARNSLLRRYRDRSGRPLSDTERVSILGETCAHRSALCATLFAEWQYEDPDSPALAETLATARRSKLASALTPRILDLLHRFYVGAELPADFDPVDQRAIYEFAYHHAAPFARPAWSELALGSAEEPGELRQTALAK